jgi:hypothetical protein
MSNLGALSKASKADNLFLSPGNTMKPFGSGGAKGWNRSTSGSSSRKSSPSSGRKNKDEDRDMSSRNMFRFGV